MKEDLLTINEYAVEYKISVPTVYRKIESGEIPEENIIKVPYKNKITHKIMLKRLPPISKIEVNSK